MANQGPILANLPVLMQPCQWGCVLHPAMVAQLQSCLQSKGIFVALAFFTWNVGLDRAIQARQVGCNRLAHHTM